MTARKSTLVLVVAVGISILGSIVAFRWSDRAMRNELLRNAQLVAQMADVKRLEALAFTADDRTLPDFQQMNREFRQLVASLQVNWAPANEYISIYSMKKRKGRIIFGPESIPAGDPLASLPGTVYKNPPDELLGVFTTHQPVVVGPFTDEYGTFISAFVLVPDTAVGTEPIVIGLDIKAGNWRTSTFKRAAFPVGLMLILLAAAVAMPLTQRMAMRSQADARRIRSFRWMIAGAVALATCGLIGWVMSCSDDEMRDALLREARLAAQTLTQDDIRALSGDLTDVDNPAYQRIKRELVDAKSAMEQCRFMHLMGRKSTGNIIFQADNEDPSSKDYSPPGQPYEASSTRLLALFDGVPANA